MRRIERVRDLVTRMVVTRLNSIIRGGNYNPSRCFPQRMREVVHQINHPRECDGPLLDIAFKTDYLNCRRDKLGVI